MPYDNWLNRTFLVWVTSMVLLVLLSLVTPPPDPEKIDGIIWSWKVAKLAGIRARAEPRFPESLPVVVPLHRSHGGTLRLHDLVPVLWTGRTTVLNPKRSVFRQSWVEKVESTDEALCEN